MQKFQRNPLPISKYIHYTTRLTTNDPHSPLPSYIVQSNYHTFQNLTVTLDTLITLKMISNNFHQITANSEKVLTQIDNFN